LVAGAATVAILGAVTVAVLGADTCRYYVETVVPKVAEYRTAWGNQSLAGLWTRLFDPLPKYDVEPLLRSPLLAWVGTVLSWAAVVAALALVVPWARSRDAGDAAFGATVTGMLLVSPITWDHYFLLLLVPLVLLWHRLPAEGVSRWTFRALLILLWLNPGVYWAIFKLGQGGVAQPATPVKTLTGLSVLLYATLGVFWLGLGLARAEGRHATQGGPS
jgi:hypothetical protein